MADSPITVQSGDKGIDRSTTNIDSSSRTSSTVDDHSIRNRTSSVDDHSVRNTSSTVSTADSSSRHFAIHANDNRREKHSNISISGGGGMLIGVVSVIGVIGMAMYVVRQTSERTAAPVTQTQAPLVQAPTVQTPVVQAPPVSGPSFSRPANQVAEAQPTTSAPTTAQPSQTAPDMPRGAATPMVAKEITPPPATTSKPAAPPKPDPATYFNVGAARAGSVQVLMVDPKRGVDAVLTQQMAAALGGSDDLFKPAFVRDGLFSRVRLGDTDILRDLGVSSEIAEIVLGERRVDSVVPFEFQGERLMRATVTFSLRRIHPRTGFSVDVAAATEIGAGYDEDGAIETATENAFKKLLKQMGK